MGTRGALGFRVNEQDHITYNHFDSYFSGLGKDVLNWLRAELAAGEEAAIKERAAELRHVDENASPTAEDFVQFQHLHDGMVSSGTDWYSLLRGMQGDPAAILAAGVMTDAHKFMADSLFCEYAYIVNFDTRELEVYQGFQRKAHKAGRYAAAVKKPRGWKPKYEGQDFYYPVKLVAAYSFDQLPTDFSELEKMEEAAS